MTNNARSIFQQTLESFIDNNWLSITDMPEYATNSFKNSIKPHAASRRSALSLSSDCFIERHSRSRHL